MPSNSNFAALQHQPAASAANFSSGGPEDAAVRAAEQAFLEAVWAPLLASTAAAALFPPSLPGTAAIGSDGVVTAVHLAAPVDMCELADFRVGLVSLVDTLDI
jgi:hypothetical protein